MNTSIKNNASFFTLLVLTLSLLISNIAVANPAQKATTYEAQTEQYAMVRAAGKLLSLTKWKVEVDFGQELEIGLKNKDLMRNSEGDVINFNSPIDALNFLNGQGWILVSANDNGESFTAVMKRTVSQ